MRAPILCIVLLTIVPRACASPPSLDVFRQGQGRISAPAVSLARKAVTTYLATGKDEFSLPQLPEIFKRKAAVFVTISKAGRTRGCKGSFEPTTSNLRDQIIQTAIGAATADIRCRPIRSNELKDLDFTVSIVGPLKRVKDANGYPPRLYGLFLRSSSKSAVLLPGEAKTTAWRLAEAKRQAGLRPGEPYELYVFETVTLRVHKQTIKSRGTANARDS